MRRTASANLGTPLQFPDQAAALQLGHFATNSVFGSHVTRMLDGTGTEADPGIPSPPLSEAVRNAAASCHGRRITKQTCGPTTSAVKQPPVARDAKEWHGFRASDEITSLLKEVVFDGTSTFAPLTECCLEQARQTAQTTRVRRRHSCYTPMCGIFPTPTRSIF
jgi:hypothetical protein